MAAAAPASFTMKHMYNLGRINPTLADLLEAFAKVYESNYTSVTPFAAFITERTDPLYSIAYDVALTGAKIVLNIRETQRAKDVAAAAQQVIDNDKTLDNAAQVEKEQEAAAKAAQEEKEKAEKAAKAAQAAADTISTDDTLVNPKD